jgi:hypothetical protein
LLANIKRLTLLSIVAQITPENTPQPSQTSGRLLISVLVFEPVWYLDQLFDNMLAFTSDSTTIVAHCSNITTYTQAELQVLSAKSPRLLINPNRYFTKAYWGSIPRAHLRNIQFGYSSDRAKDATHVMLWASNSWFLLHSILKFTHTSENEIATRFRFIRPSVESCIFAHDASMFRGVESSIVHRHLTVRACAKERMLCRFEHFFPHNLRQEPKRSSLLGIFTPTPTWLDILPPTI